MGAVRLTAKALLEHDKQLDSELKAVLVGITGAQSSSDHYEELAALYAFHQLVPHVIPSGDPARTNGLTLLDLVWRMTFPNYFWVKQAREDKSKGTATSSWESIL
jgi:hypothetical protein